MQNNGQLRQDPNLFMFGRDFGNDESVSGFGAFQFTGSTSTRGTFIGDSAANPISFLDTSQTGSQLFDVQYGTVANTVRGAFQTRGASVSRRAVADRRSQQRRPAHQQEGPAEVNGGNVVSYQVLVVNEGPRTAAAVTVTDVSRRR